jgi:CRISPR-associated protein Cmr3
MDDDPAREALWWPRVDDPAKPAQPPPWWPESVWVDWLADPRESREWTASFNGLKLARHVQAHVGIDRATGAARDEILFAHDVIECLDNQQHEWAIGCQFNRKRNQDSPGPRAAIGGDRHLARVETGANLFLCPDRLLKAFRDQPSRGIRLVAVTPAAFPAGWCPPGFMATGDEYRGRLPGITDELILRAARVPRAGHVSGWDMASGKPKPTTRLVPSGAVFHFVKADEKSCFTEAEARQLWLVTLGERVNEGFGRFVPGLWHPKENGK